MKGDDLSERIMDFTARILKLTDSLPKTYAAKHIAGQIIRSSTSAGANYEEARGAESNPDFIHKLGIVLKEVRETGYWIKLINRAQILPAHRLQEIEGECDELGRIIAKSIITARNRQLAKAKVLD